MDEPLLTVEEVAGLVDADRNAVHDLVSPCSSPLMGTGASGRVPLTLLRSYLDQSLDEGA